MAPAHYRIQVLIPEQGELPEGVQPALDQSSYKRCTSGTQTASSRVGEPKERHAFARPGASDPA
jgi:hypothetical protein